jgi:transposase-like protein
LLEQVNKAIHLVLALNIKGEKELLGMWITQNVACFPQGGR